MNSSVLFCALIDTRDLDSDQGSVPLNVVSCHLQLYLSKLCFGCLTERWGGTDRQLPAVSIEHRGLPDHTAHLFLEP